MPIRGAAVLKQGRVKCHVEESMVSFMAGYPQTSVHSPFNHMDVCSQGSVIDSNAAM